MEYLESFYGRVQNGMKSQAYNSWVVNLRTDLSAIADAAIRQGALELFRQVEGSEYVLKRNPEMLESVVLSAIRRLMDYLKGAL